MTNRTAITALIGAFILALILMFGHTAYSNNELHAADMQTLEQARKYTDNRIIESQQSTLAAISDVSKTTRLLTRILCSQQFDKNECERELGPLSRNHNGTTTY
jgi:predicted negative regulator of RcsB-dependent stress response